MWLSAWISNLRKQTVRVDSRGRRHVNPQRTVTVAMVGKYMDLLEAYKSLIEFMIHAGIHNRAQSNSVHRF